MSGPSAHLRHRAPSLGRALAHPPQRPALSLARHAPRPTRGCFGLHAVVAQGLGEVLPPGLEIGLLRVEPLTQVALRWLLQRGVVIIPKSVRPERMAQNLDILDFTLTGDEMGRITALDTGASIAFDHRDPEWVVRIGGRPRA